ncbi:hypothetical protein [Sphingomonas sp. PR090111-T3T-6A]|uniref:hypothetical protein n=1 Tax=Sphingomonas sp. PR090111-T3T-6A TaxID=685778 RepID=UPI00037C3CCC|nr:hypothetical protein [Sphingomonas sp. PR090111-T3T-6A]
MRRLLSLSLIATASLGLSVLEPLPALAQQQDRFIIIYGNDRCPSSAGQEIVVCVRQPETERYRIPKELRDNEISPTNMSWAQRAKSVEFVGKSGTQSCSNEGSGGWTGCMQKMFAEARAERQTQKKADAGVP